MHVPRWSSEESGWGARFQLGAGGVAAPAESLAPNSPREETAMTWKHAMLAVTVVILAVAPSQA